MTLDSGWSVGSEKLFSLANFPLASGLQTAEQKRSFELLRLALFALKLRKLERKPKAGHDYEFHCNLLRHAIFQQVITLADLDAQEQAMQLIKACREST